MGEASSRRIVVFGDLIDDVVVVPGGPILPDTDTSSIIRLLPGGSAANTAAWLGSLHAEVDFVGRVATDDHARHVRLFLDAGVHPILSKDDDLPTGTVVVLVDGYHRTQLTDRGANQALDPGAVTAPLLARARYLHVDGYSILTSDDESGIRSLIARAVAAGVEVSVNPGSASFLRDYGRDRFLRAVEGATFMLLNIEEGRALSGFDEPQAIVERLRESFAVVALALGDDGFWVAEEGAATALVPVVALPIVDMTGTGDAFCAAFLHARLAGHSAAESTAAGAKLSAIALGLIGGRPTP